MTIHREDLERAVAGGVVTRAQADARWERAVTAALPEALRRRLPPRAR